jgi:hypothetical protein
MHFLILFAISYKQTARIDTSNFYSGLSDFGFDQNGTYCLTFSDFDPDQQYCFALLPKHEYNIAITLEMPGDPCVTHPPHSFRFGDNATVSQFNGTIHSPDIYIGYISFYRHYDTRLSVTVMQIYRNPNSNLDSRWHGIVPAQSTLVGLLGLVVTYWFINWCLHFRVHIGIHYCLTVLFVLVIAWASLRLSEFRELDQADSAMGVTVAQHGLRILAEGMCYATILLISKGWGIIKDAIRVSEIVRSMLLCLVLAGLRVLTGVAIPMAALVLVIIAAGVAVVFFLQELLRNTHDAAMRVLAHLLAISDAGINARTTPIFQKWRLYSRFQFVLLGLLGFLLVYTCATGIGGLGFIQGELLMDGIVLYITAAFSALFRLTDAEPNGSVLFAAADEAHEVLLSDLESLTIDSERLAEGRIWEAGTPLPSPPQIVSNSTRIEITSPDGTDTVEAHIQEG